MGDTDENPTRRRVLQAMTAATTASIAGCGGGQDGGTEQTEPEETEPPETETTPTAEPQELGERVSTVALNYWTDARDAQISEQRQKIVASNLNERLGVPTEIAPSDLATGTGSIVTDKRQWALPYGRIHPKARRLDPTDQMGFIALSWITIGGGVINWWGEDACAYDNRWVEQQSLTDEEQRKQLVTEANNAATRDVAAIPITNSLNFSLYNRNLVNASNLGRLGTSEQNPQFFIESSPAEGDTLRAMASVEALASRQPTRRADGAPVWNQLVHSSLQWFNSDLERENLLADSISVEDDGQTIIVELIDGAVFHNGDPVTASDVKFSYDLVADHIDAFGSYGISPWPHESIETIDEKTVQFNLEEYSLGLTKINFPLLGIFHEESMTEAGIQDNPTSYTYDDVSNMIGSGPFKPVTMRPKSSLQLEPFDDHPLFSPDHNLTLEAFSSKQAGVQALRNDEIHTLFAVRPRVYQDLTSEDRFEGIDIQGWTSAPLWPQHTMNPTKFRPFRLAVAQAINRNLMNQISTAGMATPQYNGSMVPSTHPWHDDEAVETFEGMPAPSGDAETARQTLRDAGWGWDDQGRLHYPADADLSPLWPAGEKPDPSYFPCLDSENGS